MNQLYDMVARKANAIFGNITVQLSRSRGLIVPLYCILSQPYLEYYVHFISVCHKLGEILTFFRGRVSRKEQKNYEIVEKD